MRKLSFILSLVLFSLTLSACTVRAETVTTNPIGFTTATQTITAIQPVTSTGMSCIQPVFLLMPKSA